MVLINENKFVEIYIPYRFQLLVMEDTFHQVYPDFELRASSFSGGVILEANIYARNGL